MQLDGDNAVDGTKCNAQCNADNHGNRNRQPDIYHTIAHNHADDRHDSSDRQIHTSADHDHRNADYNDTENRYLTQNINQVCYR